LLNDACRPSAHERILKNVESISVDDIDHETTDTVVIAQRLSSLHAMSISNPYSKGHLCRLPFRSVNRWNKGYDVPGGMYLYPLNQGFKSYGKLQWAIAWGSSIDSVGLFTFPSSTAWPSLTSTLA